MQGGDKLEPSQVHPTPGQAYMRRYVNACAVGHSYIVVFGRGERKLSPSHHPQLLHQLFSRVDVIGSGLHIIARCLGAGSSTALPPNALIAYN